MLTDVVRNYFQVTLLLYLSVSFRTNTANFNTFCPEKKSHKTIDIYTTPLLSLNKPSTKLNHCRQKVFKCFRSRLSIPSSPLSWQRSGLGQSFYMLENSTFGKPERGKISGWRESIAFTGPCLADIVKILKFQEQSKRF